MKDKNKNNEFIELTLHGGPWMYDKKRNGEPLVNRDGKPYTSVTVPCDVMLTDTNGDLFDAGIYRFITSAKITEGDNEQTIYLKSAAIKKLILREEVDDGKWEDVDTRFVSCEEIVRGCNEARENWLKQHANDKPMPSCLSEEEVAELTY